MYSFDGTGFLAGRKLVFTDLFPTKLYGDGGPNHAYIRNVLCNFMELYPGWYKRHAVKGQDQVAKVLEGKRASSSC